MPRRQIPLVIRQQIQLILRDFFCVVDPRVDAEIATDWFKYCYLMARDFGRPFELESVVLTECQRLDSSVVSLDDVIHGTSEEMGEHLANRLRAKQCPLAWAFGPNLQNFLFVSAQLHLGMMTEWPAWLPGQVRLLPDNPLWIDRQGYIRGGETARPEHLIQLGEVLNLNRGGQPSIGRPRGSGDFGSPQEFRFAIVTVLRALHHARMQQTQEAVATFMLERGDTVITLDSMVRKLKRYCHRWCHHGCSWSALQQEAAQEDLPGA